MVQEFRRIMLDEDELLSAFEGYRRMKPEFLPPGKITICTPLDESGQPVSITLDLRADNDGGSSVVRTLEEEEILDPLIRFCIENNIVLPRDGKKSISVVGGYASLCIAFDFSVDSEALRSRPGAIAKTALRGR